MSSRVFPCLVLSCFVLSCPPELPGKVEWSCVQVGATEWWGDEKEGGQCVPCRVVFMGKGVGGGGGGQCMPCFVLGGVGRGGGGQCVG